MKIMREKIIRADRPRTDMLPVAAVLTLLLFLAGQFLGNLLASALPGKTLPAGWTGSEQASGFLLGYLKSAGIWAVTLFWLFLVKEDRPILQFLRSEGVGRIPRSVLPGFTAGAVLNGLCILLAVSHGDLAFSFGRLEVLPLLLFLPAVAIQAGGEELLFRCFLYQKLRRRYRNAAVAILGNALFFALLHLMNPALDPLGILQVFSMGLLLSLLVYYNGSFQAAAALHTGWNFTQSILFGLPNSGVASAYSLFHPDVSSAAGSLFYAKGFGIEGSLSAPLLLLLASALAVLSGRRKNFREDLWAKRDPSSPVQPS